MPRDDEIGCFLGVVGPFGVTTRSTDMVGSVSYLIPVTDDKGTC